MKKELIVCIVIIFFIFFILSCSESFLLTGEDEKENNIQIISLSPGGVINKGEILSFKVISTDEEENPDKLEINLYTAYGDRIGKLENTSFALNQELALDLFESLYTGLYTLEFILYIGTDVLCEKSITFFYTEKEFAIQGIESFPPVVFPGATVLLSTTILNPDKSDPYLRWTVNEKVITSGLLSEGKDKILWSVPEEEGVYTVKVELFPVPPETLNDFIFSSEIFMDVALYVSESRRPPSRYLYPEDSYYSLYHFDGNLLDTAKGRNAEDSEKRMEAKSIGKPQLITGEEDFGYYIDSYSGFRIDECILPILNRTLKPFTISLGLELDSAQQGKNILILRTYDNLFIFTIFIDSESSIIARIRSGSKEVIIPSNINTRALKNRFLISLSILPANDSLLAMWFLDGIQINTLSFNNMDIRISSDGETIIGSENGFAGVIDELGVYYIDENGRNTINPGLYKYAIQQMHGAKSIFAEGFDGIYPPDSLEIGEKDIIKSGKLILKTSLKTTFSSINLSENDLNIIVNFDAPLPAKGRISLFHQDKSTPFLDITGSGTVLIPGNESPLVLENLNQSFFIKIKNRGTKVSFPGEGMEDVKLTSLQGAGDIILVINNNGNTPIVIDSITVFKE
ncbi:MAG: hypothetical protein JXB88_22390 [Spirochaetales bacterium]|nr:hypothetical protein [Spirochaetales bacterium]